MAAGHWGALCVANRWTGPTHSGITSNHVIDNRIARRFDEGGRILNTYKTMVYAKIHRAVVTAADVNYIGSITIDSDLLRQAGMDEYERVQVVDVTNGARLETYTIAGPPGSGVIQLNGAAAHLIGVGDTVIIMAYLQVPTPVPAEWSPTVLIMDEQHNTVREVTRLADAVLAQTSAAPV
jgi:aspartate 1-decarboxylase